ncbi:MAG: phage tail protein [bacterium]|nr:phage tail protein [bacterium]
MMPPDKREDPLLGYNFQISLLDSSSSLAKAVTTIALSSVIDRPVGGFSECTGLEMSLEVEDYMEGGNNGTVLKFPGRVKWANITLKKGLTNNTVLWDWFYDFVEGRGKRKDGVITLQNEKHEPHTAWGFRHGLPLKYAGPQLNAGQSNVAVESIEIAHEGLYQLGGARELAQAVSGAAGAIKSLF